MIVLSTPYVMRVDIPVAPEELGRVAASFSRKLMPMQAPSSGEQIRSAELRRLIGNLRKLENGLRRISARIPYILL